MSRTPLNAALLCAVLVLGGCGGGGDATQPNQFAAEKITKPATPADKPARLDTAPFVQLALNSGCTERHNRMYVIDQTYVFWNSAGNCADASYSFKLYKLNTDSLVCSHGDSIAGPRTDCGDAQQRAFFDALVKNADAANLGLDATHTVEKVDLGVYAHPWTNIDRSTFSGIVDNLNLVIRDAATWIDVWTRHAPNQPLPKIDFDRQMVIAVFGAGGPNGCYWTEITAMTLEKDKLVVVRTNVVLREYKPDMPPEPIVVCTTAITRPAHLVLVDRVDVPVEFVVKRREL